MAETTELTKHGFTREQADALQRTFGGKAEPGFDRPTLMWLIGGLTALGVTVAGVIWVEIGSVRDELRGEIAVNRTQIAELAKGQARIEVILEERLPRDS